tara:strand:+ start:607 stop:1035 length:429 start_codon:yes stop_codon:yes gene_type:complete
MAYDYIKLAKAKKWNEKELNAFKNHINKGTDQSDKALDVFNDNPLIYDAEGINLDQSQIAKGFKYLYNLGFTPTGKQRSNSPFGYREEFIVKSPKSIVVKGFYQPSFWSSFKVPIYEAYGGVKGDMETMEYYYDGGKISIIG